MTQYAFHFDSSSCSGCKTCQVACKDKNNLAAGMRFRRVYEIAGGGWNHTEEGAWVPDVIAYNLSIACNHCEDPVCVKACPTRAMHIESDGIVTIDNHKCVGCHYCEWACPYGAPQYDSLKGIMQKCDFCRDYLLEGKNPACVDSCPMRALTFGKLEDIKSLSGNERSVFPLPEEGMTKPALFIRPHPGSSRAKESNAFIINREEVKQ
jgi:anaerobic dimethyl sulfoxide reductase subunit B (iron-sulfur subunit)